MEAEPGLSFLRQLSIQNMAYAGFTETKKKQNDLLSSLNNHNELTEKQIYNISAVVGLQVQSVEKSKFNSFLNSDGLKFPVIISCKRQATMSEVIWVYDKAWPQSLGAS